MYLYLDQTIDTHGQVITHFPKEEVNIVGHRCTRSFLAYFVCFYGKTRFITTLFLEQSQKKPATYESANYKNLVFFDVTDTLNELREMGSELCSLSNYRNSMTQNDIQTACNFQIKIQNKSVIGHTWRDQCNIHS